jgi:hypothetical protein
VPAERRRGGAGSGQLDVLNCLAEGLAVITHRQCIHTSVAHAGFYEECRGHIRGHRRERAPVRDRRSATVSRHAPLSEARLLYVMAAAMKAVFPDALSPLRECDPEVFALIQEEKTRQRCALRPQSLLP